MSGVGPSALASRIDVSGAVLAGLDEESARRVRRARTAALLQERALIEWDVLSRISMQHQVLDVLGGCWGPRCGAKRAPRPGSDVTAHCSRRAGHTGRHLLGTGKYVAVVWS